MYSDKEKEAATRKAYYEKRQGSQKEKDRLNAKSKKRYADRLEILDEYKREHPCPCGESDLSCLEFHHHGSDKETEVTKGAARGWSKDRLMVEIAKCTVLCANCHRKTHSQKAMYHQYK